MFQYSPNELLLYTRSPSSEYVSLSSTVKHCACYLIPRGRRAVWTCACVRVCVHVFRHFWWWCVENWTPWEKVFVGKVNQSLATLCKVAGTVFLTLVTPLQRAQRGKSSAQLVPRRPAIKVTSPWHHQAFLLPWPLALYTWPHIWMDLSPHSSVWPRFPKGATFLPRFEFLLSGAPRRGKP